MTQYTAEQLRDEAASVGGTWYSNQLRAHANALDELKQLRDWKARAETANEELAAKLAEAEQRCSLKK